MQISLFDAGDGNGDGNGDDGDHDEVVALHRAARKRYLNYALSVITSRALPDVRDGLKPVQRRILYAMFHDLSLGPDARFRKSAAIVGEVMGKYHPHGDQSIYDAMVRQAQAFSLRYPLINGHGNFGSIDGDSAAAMRYTEAKLRPLAMELLGELRQRTVDYRPNYDGQLFEPVVLPAQVPNLLVNGATGIAVGMATNIPPHHLGSVIGALIALLDDPGLSADAACERVGAPDFPTGGEILNTPEELRAIYTSGQGPVRLRGAYRTEIVNRKRCVIVTSIPYGLNKATLIEKIAQLIIARRVPQIVDIRDESTEDVRIVMELKRGANPEVAMAYLYKHTPLQLNFHVNLTCLVPDRAGVCAPKRCTLLEVLRHFLDFRLEVLGRRLGYQLEKLRRRIHILEGFELVFDCLDEAIAIIRASEGKAHAATRLMDRFGLDEVQVEAILELKLYRLARLEILEIEQELEAKRAEAARIEALLADEAAQWGVIRRELVAIADTYRDERRTRLVGPGAAATEVFAPEAYIVRERAWVIISRFGRVKRQKRFSEVGAIRVPEGDEIGWVLRTDTRQTLTFYTSTGRAYVMRVDDVPPTTGYGEAVQTFFNFGDGERVVGVSSSDPRIQPIPQAPSRPPPRVEPEEVELPLAGVSPEIEAAPSAGEAAVQPPFAVAVSRLGKAVRFPLANHKDVSTRNGRRFMSVGGAGDAVVAVFQSAGHEKVALATERGRVLLFLVDEIPARAGAARGVNGIKLASGDAVLGVRLVVKKRQGLKVFTSRGREVIVRETSYRVARRGGRGTEVIRLGSLTRAERPVEVLEPRSGEPDDDELEGVE